MKRLARKLEFKLILGTAVVMVYYLYLWRVLSQEYHRRSLPGPQGDGISLWKNGIVPYYGLENFKQKQPVFDSRFKSPCWYEEREMKCLPYFFIVGVRKCGTTQLWNYLLKHPEVLDPLIKENQLFGYEQFDEYNTNNSERVDRYVRAYQDVTNQLSTKSISGYNRFIFGDGSTSTMYVNRHWERYPGNEDRDEPQYVAFDFIHHLLPDTKIIIVFRDPIERLYSEYYFVLGKLKYGENLGPSAFHSLVNDSVGFYKDCFQEGTVRECVYKHGNIPYSQRTIRLNLGIYYVYMEDLIRVYGRKQILALHIEDIGQTSTIGKLFSFLGLTSLPEETLRRIVSNPRISNSRNTDFTKKGGMFPATRELLKEFYRPFNIRMASLMHDEYFLFD